MDDELEHAFERNPHLKEHYYNFIDEVGEPPEFLVSLSRDLGKIKYPNILYPVGDPIFVHIYGDENEGTVKYIGIEPRLDDKGEKKYLRVMDAILERAPNEPIPNTEDELKETILKLLDESVTIEGETIEEAGKEGRKSVISSILGGSIGEKIRLTPEEYDTIHYLIVRNIIGSGPLEPVIRDPYLEDIHSIGVESVFIVHKIFGMMQTNITFGTRAALDDWLRSMSERIGRPVSESTPIADGALPDGSRINIIYSDDVSRRGSSFTMRKFADIPVSIIQLINWGAIDVNLAAYMWICLENGMSIFFSGETASGKTTMLNACLPFVNRKHKIYSVEDTAEVQPPHAVWQQLITREQGPPESHVDMFTLLKAALRSRPNYIIAGEIRGVEGAVAFQAMQTGHPVLATFHASAVKKMIQRLTGDPINVPVTFIDNLNIAMILQAVYRKGDFLRRCISVEEIEGYYEEAGGVVTRAVFQWDPASDVHHFRGLNNSFILENKIADKLGYEDKREIYEDLFLRARILQRMREEGIEEYYDVLKVIWEFQEKGIDGLSIPI
ncbi:Type II/IV secretion system protein [Candidatus Methanoperedenaceae archaeon GB50]|nr:Type II/IV secretion system protein [Candidatus Methanoperedenaceae archaeon GB50]